MFNKPSETITISARNWWTRKQLLALIAEAPGAATRTIFGEMLMEIPNTQLDVLTTSIIYVSPRARLIIREIKGYVATKGITGTQTISDTWEQYCSWGVGEHRQKIMSSFYIAPYDYEYSNLLIDTLYQYSDSRMSALYSD